MDPKQHQPSLLDLCTTRRQFLNRFGMGFGALSLASLLAPQSGVQAALGERNLSPLVPREPHFPGKAKRVIHIMCQGGPSHLDTWDPKPGMTKYEGKEVSEVGGIPLPSPFKFTKMGKSGVEVSEVFSKIGE